jgi:retron-type reverse transcriptase
LAVRYEIWSNRLYWVLDIDIRKYFDSISHTHLRAFLDQRVKDGVIRRMIDKWLNAGVVEDGNNYSCYHIKCFFTLTGQKAREYCYANKKPRLFLSTIDNCEISNWGR